MNIFSKKNNGKNNSKIVVCIFSYLKIETVLKICKNCKNLQKIMNFSKYTYQLERIYEQNEINSYQLKKDASKNDKSKISSIKKFFQAALQVANISSLQLLSTNQNSIEISSNMINCIVQITQDVIGIAISKEKKIKLFDITTKKNIKNLQGHTSPILKILPGNDNNFISATFTGEIINWDISSFSICSKNLFNTSGMINIISLFNLMPCCYCASYWDVSLSIFTMEKVLYTITSPANPLQPIITMATYYDINSSNNYLLTSSRNKTVSLFYVSQEHYSHIRTVKTNSFDDDNKYITCFLPLYVQGKLFMGYNNGFVIAMNFNFTKCFFGLKMHQNPVTNLISCCENMKIISCGFKDRVINIFDVSDMRDRVSIVFKIPIDYSLIQLNDGGLISSSGGNIINISINTEKYTLKLDKRNIIFKEN